MEILAVATGLGRDVAQLTEEAAFQINLFWVIIAAINFLLFFAIVWTFAFKPVSAILGDRKARIETGPSGRRAGSSRSRERGS